MFLGSYVKQDVEDLPVDIGFADVIAGRSYTSITVTPVVPTGMSNLSTLQSGTDYQLMPSGGTHLTTYRWVVNTAIVIGGLTVKLQDEFDVIINNIPNV